MTKNLDNTQNARIHAQTLVVDRCGFAAYTSDVGELLAAILGAIAELLLEAFLEIISAVVVDTVSTAFLDLFTDLKEGIQGSRVLTGFMYGLLGVLTGALSLLILPHHLVHRERPFGFHGISLLISPVIAGVVLSCVGAVMRKWGKKVTPVETFGYGFAFALGMAVIRFLLAK